MPPETIACLSNPSSSRSSVGFHCPLYFLHLWRVYLTIPLETRDNQVSKKLFYSASLHLVPWSSRANISPENLSMQTLPKRSSKGYGKRNEGIAEASARLNRKAPSVRQQFIEADIPAYFAYARRFTLCDKFFTEVAGPSTPNHLMLIAADSPFIDNPKPGDPSRLSASLPVSLERKGF